MRFLILGILFLTAASRPPLQSSEEDLRIDSPAEYETVSGTVEITGTADLPGMTRYRVEFAYDPNPTNTWFLLYEGSEPVRQGRLAEWDTSLIHEGTYSLRVLVYLEDGSVQGAVCPAIVIDRSAPPTPGAIFDETSLPAEFTSPASSRSAFVFPASTATPVPASGSESGLPGNFYRPDIALAIGAGIALAGFLAWQGILFGKSWNRKRIIRSLRKNENNHE